MQAGLAGAIEFFPDSGDSFFSRTLGTAIAAETGVYFTELSHSIFAESLYTPDRSDICRPLRNLVPLRAPALQIWQPSCNGVAVGQRSEIPWQADSCLFEICLVR
jgi:hypothetical protein